MLTGPVRYRMGGGNTVLGQVCFCALLCPRTASRPLWGGNPTCEPELFSQRQSCTKVLEPAEGERNTSDKQEFLVSNVFYSSLPLQLPGAGNPKAEA